MYFFLSLTLQIHALKNLNPEVRKIYYPRKFYKTENNFATPIKGIYMDELINYRLQATFKDL